jgi:hypothetical protein
MKKVAATTIRTTRSSSVRNRTALEPHEKQYENEAAKVTVIHHERQVERHTDSRQGDKYP